MKRKNLFTKVLLLSLALFLSSVQQGFVQTPAPNRIPVPGTNLYWSFHTQVVDADAYEDSGDTAAVSFYSSDCEFYFPTKTEWKRHNFVIGGTAVNGEDYVLIKDYVWVLYKSCLGESAPFPSDWIFEPREKVTIIPIADNIEEGDETVILSWGNGNKFAILRIHDTFIEHKLGDVDQDGKITITDALKIAQFSIRLDPPTFFPEYADVNSDGMITIIDALIIAQYCVGLVSNLPI